MPLTIEQTKRLYNALYERIVELHFDDEEFKNKLKMFTSRQRSKGWKGMILLDYTNIDQMISAVKNKNFEYEWIPKNKASMIKHQGIRSAVTMMNPKTDCVLTCSLSMSLQHLYINCVKIKNIDG